MPLTRPEIVPVVFANQVLRAAGSLIRLQQADKRSATTVLTRTERKGPFSLRPIKRDLVCLADLISISPFRFCLRILVWGSLLPVLLLPGRGARLRQQQKTERANPSATFAARESTAPEAPERGDSPTPGQGSLARDFLHVHFFGAGRNRAKPDVDFRAVWRRARVCRAKVHHALRYLDLVAPVPVTARVNAIASCQASVSVGAAPKGSVSEARNSHPIRHQQIERFSILASPSNLLLHVLRCPRGAGGRAFPLGAGKKKSRAASRLRATGLALSSTGRKRRRVSG